MFMDGKLVCLVRAKAENVSQSRREAIERLLKDYDNACALSRGGVRSRSNHWEMIARAIQEELEAFSGYEVKKFGEGL